MEHRREGEWQKMHLGPFTVCLQVWQEVEMFAMNTSMCEGMAKHFTSSERADSFFHLYSSSA